MRLSKIKEIVLKERLINERPIKDLCDIYGVSASTISRWANEWIEENGELKDPDNFVLDRVEEIQRLRRDNDRVREENERLRMENEIYRKMILDAMNSGARLSMPMPAKQDVETI